MSARGEHGGGVEGRVTRSQAAHHAGPCDAKVRRLAPAAAWSSRGAYPPSPVSGGRLRERRATRGRGAQARAARGRHQQSGRRSGRRRGERLQGAPNSLPFQKGGPTAGRPAGAGRRAAAAAAAPTRPSTRVAGVDGGPRAQLCFLFLLPPTCAFPASWRAAWPPATWAPRGPRASPVGRAATRAAAAAPTPRPPSHASPALAQTPSRRWRPPQRPRPRG